MTLLKNIAATAPLCVAATFAQAVTQTDNRPNVVFVLLDDVGWGYLQAYDSLYRQDELNQDFIREVVKNRYTPQEALKCLERATPTLSELSARGVIFTDACATSSMSSPSRAGILSGRYQQRFGYYMNDESREGIPTDIHLMPWYLQQAGYRTAAIGKYHIAPEITRGACDIAPEHNPLRRGFDYYFGFNYAQTTYYNSPTLYRGEQKAEAKGYLTDQLTDEALGFINSVGDKPFMLYLAYNAVHGPLNLPAPDSYLAPFKDEPQPVATFYSYLYAVDCNVKRIMERLHQLGKERNTLFIFSADNGSPGSGSYPLPKNGPFRGFKGQTWQGGLHIPLFMTWSARLPAGKSVNALVSLMDIFPTVFEAAGVAQPEKIDGRSLLPLATGRTKASPHDNIVWMGIDINFYEMTDSLRHLPSGGGSFAVRQGKWVLRWNSTLKRVTLYDYEKDRGEKNDVAAQNPAVVDSLAAIYDRWQSQMLLPKQWRKSAWEPVVNWRKTGSQ